MNDQKPAIPVAVIGVGALFPGSDTAQGFWKDILAGTDLITDVPEHRWLIDDYYDPDQSVPDKTYGKRGGFLNHAAFDPVKFGIPPNVIEATDTAQLLALIVAQQVLDDAFKGQFADVDKSKMSVVLGVTAGTELLNEMACRLERPVWVKALREVGFEESEVQRACDQIAAQYTPWQENTFPGVLGNVVAGRIANRFDFGGTNCVTDAACASSLSALSLGLNELYLGHSDIVISGGVDTFSDIFMYMCFSKTPALSATGDCRPFSDKADGTILGEGLAMFALKRLDDAERDGDRVYAVIRGCGSSSDGRAKSIYAPRSEGQASALSRAYDRAGYDPSTVELVEAHGTGTKAGDVAEFGGLKEVFTATDQRTALGSIKSQIGHTKAAAGAAGLFKVVLGLHHRVLPPTLKVDAPNPKLNTEDSAFYINTKARPWIRENAHPRRGSVSAFGFGGSNFHVTLEEYVGKNRAKFFRPETSDVFLYSADNTKDLVFETPDDFHKRANDSRHAFDPTAPIRVGFIAKDLDEYRKKANLALDALQRDDEVWRHPTGIFFDRRETAHQRLALLFPGQGSQYLNMGSDWLSTFPMLTAQWDTLADVAFDGTKLVDVVFPKPVFESSEEIKLAQRVTETQWAQPALGATNATLLDLTRTLGLAPVAYAGHSYGELTALHAAGVFDQDTLMHLSRKRGELMRDASELDGAMTAVSSDIKTVLELLTDGVVIANHNGEQQVVVSGPSASIALFEETLKAKKVAFKRLNVATAFHSPIVERAVEPFAKFLSTQSSDLKNVGRVYANASAKPYTADEFEDLLTGQIKRPVRWVEQIRAMLQDGITTFVEVGPSTVLGKLTKRIVGDDATVVSFDQRGRSPWTNFLFAVAELSTSGTPVDFSIFDTFETPLPPTKPKMVVELAGGNYNKPYPPPGGSAALPKPNKIAKDVMTDFKKPNTDPPTAPITEPVEREQVRPAPAAANVWLDAFQESQRQMAHAHVAYQNAMAQSHTAFLNALAQSQASMAAALTGQPMSVQTQPVPIQAPAVPTPTLAQTPIAQPQTTEPAPTVFQTPTVPTTPVAPPPSPALPSAPQFDIKSESRPAPVYGTPSVPTAAIKPSITSIEDVLLNTIAEKTGYPREMLTNEMQLEADLGIDSIKRVEILSVVTDSTGQFTDVDPSEMNSIQTIGGILDFLKTNSGPTNGNGNGNGHTNGHGHSKPDPITEPVAVSNADFQSELLGVVSDKTGYPIEMLNLDMKLEADLGIDSIKRVEILSEVTDRNPTLDGLDGTDMAGLATLGEIVDFVETSVKKK